MRWGELYRPVKTDQWVTRFAVLPMKIGDEYIWWEKYEKCRRFFICPFGVSAPGFWYEYRKLRE
jgi:hypothetical protein